MEDGPSTSGLGGTATLAAADMDKLIALFTGPNSHDLHDRHVAAILKLCKGNQQGFAIRDLPKVQQILELSVALLRYGNDTFLEPVCELVAVLAKPFIRRTATDEFKMLSNITSILATLGTVFRGELPEQLQVAALQTVTTFANAHGTRPSALELGSAQHRLEADAAQRQYHTNQGLLCRSGIIPDLLQALAAALLPASPTPALAVPVVGALLSLSYSADNCAAMLTAGVLQCLAVLVSADCHAPITAPAVELLWNVLENAADARAVLVCTSLPSLERVACGEGAVAADYLPSSSTSGRSSGAAALQGAPEEAGPSWGSGSAGGAAAGPARGSWANLKDDDDGWVGSSGNNAGTGGAPSPQRGGGGGCSVVQPLADGLGRLLAELLHGGFSKADKELRNDILVVLNLLLEAEPFRLAAAHAQPQLLFPSLLAVSTCPEAGARPDLVHPHVLTTDPLDLELRLLAWGALVAGCLLPDQLAAAVAGGFVRVLLLYVSPGAEGHPAVRRWNADQLASLRAAALSKLHQVAPLCPDEYERAGGPDALLQFLGAASGLAAPSPAAQQHLEAALRHLHRLVTLVPESRDALGTRGLTPLLLNIIQDTSGKPEPTLHFALMVVSAMCTLHADNQRRLRKAQGVGVLLSALARLRGLDPLLPSPYAVAVLDAVWCGVVPDRKSAARFLVEEGLDHLLSAMEGGNKTHRPIILSVLSDLLENPRAHAFFHDWRSDTNKQTAAHMLITFWNEEDALRGITQEGLLTNTARPLAGMEKRTRWLPQEMVAYGNMSAAKKEVLTVMTESVPGEAVLAKVYGVLKLLGFDSFAYLSAADQAVLAGVEKYVKFRQGDVWRSMAAEFEGAGMRPTAPDRARLASGIELSESLAVGVREAQARLLGRAQAGAAAVEGKFFADMRAQRKLEEEYRFLALQDRTAMTLGELRAAKTKKEEMLKSSMREFLFQDNGGGGGDDAIAVQ